MKSISALIVLIISTMTVSAQWASSGSNVYNTNTGNVGIGTVTPIVKLDIEAPTSDNDVTLLRLGHRSNYNRSGAIFEIGIPGYDTIGASRIVGYNSPHTTSLSQLAFQTWNGSSWNNIYMDGSGNLGIGTTTPTEKLTIAQAVSAGYNSMLSLNELTNNGSNSRGIDFKFAGLSGFPWGSTGRIEVARQSTSSNFGMVFHTATNGVLSEKVRILNNGNVGIGTSAPVTKLDVRGSVSIGTSKLFTINPDYAGSGELPSGTYLGTNGSNSLGFAPSADVGAAGTKVVFTYYSAGWHSAIEYANVSSGYSNLLLMKSGGNVGIGTITPNANASLDVNGNIFSNGTIAIGTTDMTKISSYSLAVNGAAIFTKAVVKANTAWPDYVFTTGYKIPKLDSLESFINTNGHLPDIPTVEDVKKNGIDLGENQAMLLKKIEELTLIVIEQNKRIENQQKIDEAQTQKISELEKKVNSRKEK